MSQTEKTYKYISPEQKEIIINEEFILTSNSQQPNNSEINSRLSFKIQTSNGFKTATYIDINLINFIQNEVYKEYISEFEKKTFKDTKLVFRIKCEKIKDAAKDSIDPMKNISLNETAMLNSVIIGGMENELTKNLHQENLNLENRVRVLENNLQKLNMIIEDKDEQIEKIKV